MDVNALRDRIQSTLDANADNRRQAELDLKYVWPLLLLIMLFANLFFLSFLGRDSAGFYQRSFRYSAGRAE